ncbi:Aste57867_7164 [Aphanomyces stellatus]|uniref:Aste57867_5717 protein n=1 Tax=Aphanomyces stellatus TaxID=120398 RepID=A0A485KHW1_9STRA|nr:hypothetical protein As57867_007139 [Aphanomyces stellatus]KAF0709890.1 hypothetical protein As57867_005704 [Aphanomyces stellatus]VFT82753.1 Aste57867_5717 [Aphanomyces stellatus]VFT84096.1 Aste57867_7164 [Aphanomyces stellatus]
MADLDDELDAMMEEEDDNEEDLTQEDVDEDDNEDGPKTQSTENTDEENENADDEEGGGGEDGGGDDEDGENTGGDEDTAGEEEDMDDDDAENLAKLKFIQALPEGKAREHEQFRRSHFDKTVIKRCMMQVIEECSEPDRKAPTVHNNMSIIMSGLAKKFVGELTEKARELMASRGDTGPIRPHHLREVHRKYYKRHPLARGRQRRRLLA